MYEYLGIYVSELKEYGALVVTTTDRWKVNKTVTVWQLNQDGDEGQEYYADVKEYTNESGTSIYAAVFPRLPAGNYGVSKPDTSFFNSSTKKTTIFPGICEEVKP